MECVKRDRECSRWLRSLVQSLETCPQCDVPGDPVSISGMCFTMAFLSVYHGARVWSRCPRCDRLFATYLTARPGFKTCSRREQRDVEIERR